MINTRAMPALHLLRRVAAGQTLPPRLCRALADQGSDVLFRLTRRLHLRKSSLL
jgi:hypothetical protein